MSTKQINLIASALRASKPIIADGFIDTFTRGALTLWEITCANIADGIANETHPFNRDNFYLLCGYRTNAPANLNKRAWDIAENLLTPDD